MEDGEDRSAIPDVDFHDFEFSWYVYQRLEAVEWDWTALQVLAQPEALMEDLMTWRGLYSKVKDSM